VNPDGFVFRSRRSTVYGTAGMVAASQPLAAASGIDLLQKGGNAADAAVAVAAALNVTEPTSTGLGGDCFILFHEAAKRKVYALNGSGRAPAALNLERLQREGFSGGLPPMHPYTITVPGACAGWCDLLDRFGSRNLKQILAPAIRLAEEGFPVAPLTAHFWQRAAKGQLARAVNGGELLIDGRGPREGEVFRNPGLARTLRVIAEGGKKAFYAGQIAEAIEAIVSEAGGCLQVSDLVAHTSSWEEPISTLYRGKRIWECPPNGQGLVALLALNTLSGFDLAGMGVLSVERLHCEIEAIRLAFADGLAAIADPNFVNIPLSIMMSEKQARSRRRLIKSDRCATIQKNVVPSGSDTVYFCVVDGMGNACSFINSNYMGFGTGIVPRGWGFSLQNRGHNFSLDPHHPNHLEPGKRPYHTIIPGLVTNEEDHTLYAAFGVMGGFMQPQGHVQVLSAMLDDGLDPQAALDQLRFCLDVERPDGTVLLEEGIPASVVKRLGAIGHPVKVIRGYERAVFGRGQIIRREGIHGTLCGGSDPRSDGCVMVV
jgi:gamma-glutamyltranspeptidase/glutathione hydrolase